MWLRWFLLICGHPFRSCFSRSLPRNDNRCVAAKVGFLSMSHALIGTSNSWQGSFLYINLGLTLLASPARLRVSQGKTALRSVAHSAMRPHRGVAPGIPVCPPREHVPPRPLRRIALWSVLLESKTIPPLHPSPASGRAVCLLGSGKPTVKTHTHECGSISSGWPPNQPASRIARPDQNSGFHPVGADPPRFCPARTPSKLAATPSLTRTALET